MRELQALLKEKYFADIINNYDHRSNIFNSINLRYKLNDLSSIDNNVLLFINNSIKITDFSKLQQYTNSSNLSTAFNTINYFFITNVSNVLVLHTASISYIINQSIGFFKITNLTNLIQNLFDILIGSVIDICELMIFNLKTLFTNSLNYT